MDNHTGKYEESIRGAKSGSGSAEKFLRLRLRRTAETMPTPLLIALSEQILEYRRGELRSECERN